MNCHTYQQDNPTIEGINKCLIEVSAACILLYSLDFFCLFLKIDSCNLARLVVCSCRKHTNNKALTYKKQIKAISAFLLRLLPLLLCCYNDVMYGCELYAMQRIHTNMS